MGQKKSKRRSSPTRVQPLAHGQNRRPGSPPRGLSSILNSDSLTDEFRVFLEELDQDAGDAEPTRVLWLNFVIRCRTLHSELDRLSVKHRNARLRGLHSDFFSTRHRLVLENRHLWSECQNLCSLENYNNNEYCEKEDLDLSCLWMAHDEALEKLDDLHQPFLLEKGGKQAH